MLARIGKIWSPRALLGAVENDVLPTDGKEFPQKFRTTTWPSKSTAGCTSKRSESSDLKRYLHPMFRAALFTMDERRKPRKSLSEGEHKMWWGHV